MVNDEPCLTIMAAARRKKVSRSAIWLACTTGRLRFIEVGDRKFIPVKGLEAYTPDPQARSRGQAAASARA
jgi:hypothetical protein